MELHTPYSTVISSDLERLSKVFNETKRRAKLLVWLICILEIRILMVVDCIAAGGKAGFTLQ